MRALLSILFNFAVFVLWATQAQASVCFLPGKLAGVGCDASPDRVSCGGYNHNGPCTLSGEVQTTCDHLGHRYYKCECDPLAVQESEIKSGLYVCKRAHNEKCGCSRKDAECNKTIYPQHGCPGTNSHGLDEGVVGGAFCVDPNNETIWYKECLCDAGYDYPCTKTGLAKPDTKDYCELPGGKFQYRSCACAQNWMLNVTCNTRTDGCTIEESKVENGAGGWCYHCANENCSSTAETNLEVLWCSYASQVEINCKNLGYTVEGACPEGTTGPACPFDKNYHFCQEITPEQQMEEVEP